MRATEAGTAELKISSAKLKTTVPIRYAVAGFGRSE
jgi:hypothetical protein